MSDIELVIKIPEDTYRRIKGLVNCDYFEHDICGYCMRRIADGIPLPKGHGRLIDADELKGRTTNYDKECCRIWHEWDIDNAPTVFDCRACKHNGNERECSDCYGDHSNFVKYEERPQGKWEYTQYDGDPNIGTWHCSECRYIVFGGYNQKPSCKFCPNCGADMRGGKQ